MIKLTAIAVRENAGLELTFSDGRSGVWSAEGLLSAETELSRPLADNAYFSCAFIEVGALAWPNGLELAPWTLREELRTAGRLKEARAA